MENQKRNLNINGSGSYPGGEFDRVSIAGSGKITGDLKCEKFSTAGSSKVEGNIVCDRFSVAGSSKIEGNVKGRKIEINGSCKIVGGIEGEEARICGSATIEGGAKVGKLGIYGSVAIGQDIEAEELCIKGMLKHEAFINAEKVIIDSSMNTGRSLTFNEIGASHVSMNKEENGGFWKKVVIFLNGKAGRIVGNVIEADYIQIEAATIGIIRGGHVEIGPECEIETVEYTESITIHETARVGNVKQIEK
ncbi:MAG: polymer-forming cytoskeletal protein [Cellulosilyticaceae bacterium]